MMKRSLALAAALAAAFTTGPAWGAEKFKVATMAPADSPWHEALQNYKKSLEKRTQGGMVMQLFMGGKLGSEKESIDQVKFGSTECAGVSTGAFAGSVPGLDVFELPFVWDNPEQAAAALRELHPYFEKRFDEKGYHLVGWSENGWRNFMTAGAPVKSTTDLKGKKFRSQENALHLAFWQAFDAKGVPIPTQDFGKALQSGLIQGGDNSVVLTAAFGWNSTIKSFTVSNHMYQPAVVVCNKAWYDKLTPDSQTALDEEMLVIEKDLRGRLARSEREFLEYFKQQGVTVYELSEKERAEFASKTAGVRKKFSATMPKDVIQVVEKIKGGKL